jgi:dipeptidyl aminopeptidase/acylaminoacyl peptidase
MAALVLFGLLAGCLPTTPSAVHPALKNASLPRFIAVEEFFQYRNAIFEWKVSPDGKWLSWLALEDDRYSIHFRPVDGRKVQHILIGSSEYYWTLDSRRFLLYGATGGRENIHIYMADTAKPDQPPVDLTPFKDNTRAFIVGFVAADPDVVLVGHNGRDKDMFDLYRIELSTQKSTLISQNPGNVLHWILDEQGVLRARILYPGGEKMALELKAEDKEAWREVLSWRTDEEIEVLDFKPDGRSMNLLSNIGRDRISLVRFDPETGQQKVIFEDPEVDLSRALISEVSGRPAMAFAVPDYPRVSFLDEAWQKDLAFLEKESPANLEIVSTDLKERLAVVRVSTDRTERYELVNRDTGERTVLSRHFLSRFYEDLVPVKPVSFKSRDGLTLHGYLTRPPGAAGRLPMVLLVHGGPWSRDEWTLNPTVQFLANRGYAVLQVNFRGSGGYGRSFMQAGVGEFGRKMHTDLLDAVAWAVDQGVADPEKVAIYGGSYGGYATLVGMTFTPNTFACGVDFAGISELASLIKSDRKNLKWLGPNKLQRFVGNPDDPKDLEEIKTRSPLYKADQVRRPLLIAHGANDPRVQKDQASQMVRALRQAGKEVDYLLLPDEGHGVAGHQSVFYHKIEEFLAKHLGGRTSGY